METKSQGYLHGYTKEEQNRLYQQARFLETSVFESIDFSKSKRLLEVACGVGAQTEILLKRFPHIKIDGIDASQEQLHTAEKHLKNSMLVKVSNCLTSRKNGIQQQFRELIGGKEH